ncbi:MAG TPA: hypothetical protein VFP95_05180 [Gammaproteobacteria bacterium]|nr:hypothetical protein [Gammaproteobacteria bacterium]
MMQRGRAVVVAIILAASLAGCVSYSQNMHRMQRLAMTGQPEQALHALEAAGLKHDEQLLYWLNKGLLLRQNEDYAASIEAFEKAKVLLRRLEAISVTGATGSVTISETVSDYTGQAYERIMLHVYQALNYLALNNREAARVEALQIDLLLRRLYPQTQTLPHGGDVIGRYLAGLIFEANGEADQALVSYRYALQTYSAQGWAVPRDLQQRLLRLSRTLGLDAEYSQLQQRFSLPQTALKLGGNTGQAVVILSAGLVPHRIGVSSVSQDLTTGRFYRISLPKLIPYPRTLQRAWLSTQQQQVTVEPVMALNPIAQQTLADQIPAMTLRAIARMVVKEAAADAVAREHGAGAASLVNFLGVIAEQADTRQWGLLPAHVYLAALHLPAGEHDITLTIKTAHGLVNKEFKNVIVTANDITFLSQRIY